MDQVEFAKLYKIFVETCESLKNAKTLPGFRAEAGKARYLKGNGIHLRNCGKYN